MLPRSRVCFFLFFPSISQQQVPVNHILFVFIRGGFRLFALILKTFFHPISDIFLEQKALPIAGVLYGVKYWLSKSTSKMCQKFSVIITNICVFFVFKTKRELKCLNEAMFLILSEVFVLITANFWRIFWRTFWQHYLTPYKTPADDTIQNYYVFDTFDLKSLQ